MSPATTMALVRRRSLSGDPDQDDKPTDGHNGASSNSDGPVQKRRRSRKGLEKRFECNAEGCGKSYSRAEHLYRHQLNHSAKTLFECNYPDCTRTFVRGDLLKRHLDRHTAKGSQLSRRDSVISHVSQAAGSASPEAGRAVLSYGKSQSPAMQYQPTIDTSGATYASMNSASTYSNGSPINGHHNVDMYGHNQSYRGVAQHHPQQQSPVAPQRPVKFEVPSPIPAQQSLQRFNDPASHTPQAPSFVPQQQVLPFSLPPQQYPSAQTVSHQNAPQNYAPATAPEYTEQQTAEMMILSQISMPGTGPVFGGDGDSHKSPYAGLPEDFLTYLFNISPGDKSPMSPDIMRNSYQNYGDLQNNQYSIPYFQNEAQPPGYFPQVPQQIMAVNNLLDQNVPEATISEEKCTELFEYISHRFPEHAHTPRERRRDSILDGDRSNGDHMLSKRMMQAYIGSYWYHFSDQIPILHKPTFSPDRTPNLLLLAMMTIGAACLDRTHGPKVTQAGAKLSNFLAWQLRWEIFMDVNFRPPAKLWVFQTLILLELYEKMYSTRELHERAHIHHATTIQLMRRGRSLIGKSAIESPPNPLESISSSRHSSTSGVAATPDEWWNQWIMNEATRRTAYAAFVVDSIHATMFGHSGVMVAHELRLPLPCDESLWRATSSAEVGRVESNIMSQGLKPISFLEGLKRTLSNQEVQTNSFGRTVLMAGLLSVTWHMNQRDLQVNVLGGGVIHSLGGRDKWRSTLTRAYDKWKTDYDKTLERRDASYDPYRYDAGKDSQFNIDFESRTVLHHLAHMAMHADIVDVQMFARAKRLLGRAIGPHEFNSAQKRIKDNWAPSARARDATFYALKFLCSVLVPGEVGSPHAGMQQQKDTYEARHDVLLNRPWVLYFATLVVWCYGYAREGPPPNVLVPRSTEEKWHQMREYLLRFGKITDPSELQMARGINNNTALLMVLRDSFENTRWELLHEGSTLLNNCVQLNTGQSSV